MKLRWKIAQAAEIRWWKKYLAKRDVTEYLDWKKNYWNKFLSDIQCPIKDSHSVLDLGCGPAGIYIILKENETTAVDPLIHQYELKLAHFKQQWYPNVKFVQSPLETFSSETKFEKIFCLNVINHVADIRKSFEKLANSCHKGGELILSVDTHNHKWLKKIFQLLPGDILHPHQYDLNDYRAFLREFKFKETASFNLGNGYIFDYWVIKAIKE